MYLGYLRVSTDKQDNEKQKHLILEYAHANNFKLDRFMELEISSRKSEKQRRITELKETLKADDTLIVAELSRLGRNMLETMNLIQEIQRKFLFELLKSSILLNQFEQRSSGGNYPAITQEEIGKVHISLPTIEVQNKIANHIQTLRDEAQTLKNEAIQIFEDAKKDVEKMILGDVK